MFRQARTQAVRSPSGYRPWAALAHRNFRLFVFGQGISVIGTWMQQIAAVWLVYRLSNSSFLLGLADFASQIPAALVLPVAGVLTNRWNRQHTVLATQCPGDGSGPCAHGPDTQRGHQRMADYSFGLAVGPDQRFDATARQVLSSRWSNGTRIWPMPSPSIRRYSTRRLVGPAMAGLVIAPSANGLASSQRSELPGRVGLAAGHAGAAHHCPGREMGIFAGLGEGFQYVTGSMPSARCWSCWAW